MPGQRPILAMSFIASLGITAEILACTIPKAERINFWPLTVFLLYLILPLPMLLAKKVTKDMPYALGDGGGEKKVRDLSIFITAGLMVSTIALPVVMARSPSAKPLIEPISCFFLGLGNFLCLTTIGLFCIYFKPV